MCRCARPDAGRQSAVGRDDEGSALVVSAEPLVCLGDGPHPGSSPRGHPARHPSPYQGEGSRCGHWWGMAGTLTPASLRSAPPLPIRGAGAIAATAASACGLMRRQCSGPRRGIVCPSWVVAALRGTAWPQAIQPGEAALQGYSVPFMGSGCPPGWWLPSGVVAALRGGGCPPGWWLPSGVLQPNGYPRREAIPRATLAPYRHPASLGNTEVVRVACDGPSSTPSRTAAAQTW